MTVGIKNWWESRTIWVQVAGVLAAMCTMIGVNLDVEAQSKLVAGILVVSNAVTVWLRRDTNTVIRG